MGLPIFLSEKLLHLCGSVVDIYAVHRQNVIQPEHTALVLASLHLAGQNVAAHLQHILHALQRLAVRAHIMARVELRDTVLLHILAHSLARQCKSREVGGKQ